METKLDQLVKEFSDKFKELNTDGKSAYVLILNDGEKDASNLRMQGFGHLIVKSISNSMKNESLDRIIRIAVRAKDDPFIYFAMNMMNKNGINNEKKDNHE